MSKTFRGLMLLAILGVAILFFKPTIQWYFFTTVEQKVQANQPLELIGETARVKALADMASLEYLIRQDRNELLPPELQYFEKMAKRDYKNSRKTLPSVWTVYNVLLASSDKESVIDYAVSYYATEASNLKMLKNQALKLGLDLAGGLSATLQADFTALNQKLGRTANEQEKRDAILSTLSLVRDRADEFGTTEPAIRRQGSDQILVELPGEKDPDAVNRLIRGKGTLAFHLVSNEYTERFSQYYAANPTAVIDAAGRIADRDVLPIGYIVGSYHTKDQFGVDVFRSYVVLEEEVGLDGKHIVKANTSFDEFSKPVVTFSLDAEGASVFGKLTEKAAANGQSLAVVMDDKVRSVASVRQALTGGSVMVSGFTLSEATDLSTILKTASLPLDLSISSMQKIGPTLGQETIEAGLQSLIMGITLVFAFMIAYYKGAGVIACIVLLANLLLTLGILSSMGFTLTLTSLAGLVLNIGMAVDANVLIHERIKEELALGKGRKQAINVGFSKAGFVIIDANVTTLIAAVSLSLLGSGSIKGFAVTLCVGIFTTLFTALFVSRLLFDFGTEQLNRQKVSIGWGVKQ